MQQRVINLAYLFIPIIIGTNCFSQQYPFIHYTPREGLANNRARAVYQDSKGKLYITTFAGLSVYDGSRFITYNTRNGLATEFINDIEEMGEDSIWLLTNSNKINCLVNGRITDFIPSDGFTPLINHFIKCSDGNYYAMADEGLFRLANNKFIKLPFAGIPDEQAQTFTSAIEIDKKLFITSNPGYQSAHAYLLVYDLVKSKLLFHDRAFQAICVFKPSPHMLWVSGVKGMFMLDDIFFRNNTIKFIPLPDSFHIPKNLFASFIYKDRQNNVWLSCPKGLYKISPGGSTTIFTVENGLITNLQTSILQDHENNMWFTNEQSGLSKLSNQQLVYYKELKPGFAPTDVFVSPLSDTVFFYDASHQKLAIVLPDGNSRQYSNLQPVHDYARFVSANQDYLLSHHVIFHLDKDEKSKKYSLSKLYENPSRYGFTSALREKNGSVVAISDKLFLIENHKLDSQSLNYMADQLTIDTANRVWVAPRSNQLLGFEIVTTANNKKLSLIKQIENILPGSSPRSIVADKSGNIWIGSRDWGLFYFHFDEKLNLRSTRQLTTQNGLSENFINQLFCDKDNKIWACTPSGVDRITVVNDNFQVENITRNNNIYSPVSKVQQTAKGLFWILTGTGVVAYDPTKTAENNWIPHLIFSNVLVNNSDKIILRSNGELKHFQNNLAFYLSAPSYIAEKQTRFSYFLEGSGNDNWSAPSVDAVINFVNLPPGDYTLKARASFLHGKYPDVGSSFSFTILPPWWQTWWFKSVFGLVIVGLFLLGLRFYINRKLEVQRVMLEKKQAIEKERTRIATDMHDDLGAGLSQIKFLSEAIGMKRQKHMPIEEEVSSIRSFSDEMIDKMGEIVWALNEKNDTLSDLLSYARSYAVEYLAHNGIKCHIEQPEDIPQVSVSGEFRRNIYLTVKESLHNIVKHAQATDVIITIEVGKWLTIQIRDNGIGLSNSSPSPFGNGLTNMRNRIKELKGTFDISNQDGTIVTMTVPLDQ